MIPAQITWRPVESSNVAMIGWPKSEPLLLVRFKGDGRCYGYLGVSRSRSVYMATRCASVGSYVNKVIKPKFSVVRIPELDISEPPF